MHTELKKTPDFKLERQKFQTWLKELARSLREEVEEAQFVHESNDTADEIRTLRSNPEASLPPH